MKYYTAKEVLEVLREEGVVLTYRQMDYIYRRGYLPSPEIRSGRRFIPEDHIKYFRNYGRSHQRRGKKDFSNDPMDHSDDER